MARRTWIRLKLEIQRESHRHRRYDDGHARVLQRAAAKIKISSSRTNYFYDHSTLPRITASEATRLAENVLSSRNIILCVEISRSLALRKPTNSHRRDS